MNKIACITSYSIDIESEFNLTSNTLIDTIAGKVSLTKLELDGSDFFVLKRSETPTMPHNINYKANMLALKKVGVTQIISTSISGSINKRLREGDLVLLDQFIDFTKTRDNTIYDSSDFHFRDMTYPYCEKIRKIFLKIARANKIKIQKKGCYVGVDGPRYETAAEIKMFRKLGGDVIGMSNIPEVIFSRELNMCYSSICLISNMAAGITKNKINISDISSASLKYKSAIKKVIVKTVKKLLTADTICNCS